MEAEPFPLQHLLDRVEELAVKVYALTNDRDELDAKLAAVTADNQLIHQAINNLPGDIGRLIMIEYGRLKHKEQLGATDPKPKVPPPITSKPQNTPG